MHRRAIIAAGLLFVAASALAQDATPGSPAVTPSASAAQAASDRSGYRLIAIAAGAVVGVAVVEFLSAGTFTPVLMVGGPAMAVEPAAAAEAPAVAAAVVDPATTTSGPHAFWFLDVMKPAGAVVGGQIASWIYGP